MQFIERRDGMFACINFDPFMCVDLFCLFRPMLQPFSFFVSYGFMILNFCGFYKFCVYYAMHAEIQ